jgi:predicted nucleotidyltransferase
MTTATAGFLDAGTDAYVRSVLRELEARVPLVEAYLVGSAAAGGFDPRTSDVDLVAVLERPLDGVRGAVVAAIAAIPCPVRDLELVLYVAGMQPPAFELNLNEGEERPNEERFWFVLDAALAQEHAVPLLHGRAWLDVFERVEEERIREAARESLAWAERRPEGDEFARVHAARTRSYLSGGSWLAKAEAPA